MTTIKQQKAIDNLVGNGGNVTQAMLDAGYSPNTANTPQKLTESKAYLSIAEQIPDDLLLKVHLEGLNASKITKMGEQEIAEPDYAVRHKYLDTAHKIKGTYAPEKTLNLNVDIDVSDPQAQELAREFEERLKKTDL